MKLAGTAPVTYIKRLLQMNPDGMNAHLESKLWFTNVFAGLAESNHLVVSEIVVSISHLLLSIIKWLGKLCSKLQLNKFAHNVGF